MPVSRRRYDDARERLSRCWGRVFQLQYEARVLEHERDVEQAARREMRRLLSEAEADVQRLAGQVRRLEGLLRTAGREHGAEAARAAARLDRTVRACARYRAEATELRRRPHPSGGRALALAEQARRSLAAQLEIVQRSNDVMSRQLVDRAGTLAKRLPVGEPGVAP
ncbi:hypothetical protein I5Q34_33525 [Streptomyces sp. AV19]|uniref:hypothetical protein n=1 Tax=Streptomyces sp. AV19 TaxID=2793068 RepID=UPI0018FE4964|nr:hypothetical protein [Streptomyces sp. AV19]MBH1939123.1 hypothetical protein [Streptomyces sp. AV19]MDG4535275.1 hypothetical protein [Streptomyces sp. AV19]